MVFLCDLRVLMGALEETESTLRVQSFDALIREEEEGVKRREVTASLWICEGGVVGRSVRVEADGEDVGSHRSAGLVV